MATPHPHPHPQEYVLSLDFSVDFIWFKIKNFSILFMNWNTEKVVIEERDPVKARALRNVTSQVWLLKGWQISAYYGKSHSNTRIIIDVKVCILISDDNQAAFVMK